MSEVPNAPHQGPQYDDRHVHERHVHDREPRVTPEGPLHFIARSAWQAVLLAGIAAFVLGVLVLVWPGASLLAAGVLFGLYLLFSGVLQLVAAFGTHLATSLRVMAFISGALSILLGLFCFRGPMQSTLLLALWIGIGWLFRGITQTLAAASDPTVPARGWQIFLGIVSSLAGIVLIVSPFTSIAVLTLVGGCWLLAVGVTEIVTAFVIRGRAKHIPAVV
ncbi:HdeD family acid-resistance protein [Streptomyces mirabilis]|uniref:HdeD family acid-resistance protein n=1 Tax=Streptomyces TaxID=1883 RepID=UPI0029AC4C46|nr:HdeD family acid-resistance protein [Streptomyces sp. AK02-04a]MDX3760094.1 HdeD family acid-resistance protein [Streptomyces sp. AK02-04a]